jgi:formylmethanofuran dehydrogenase subunit D
VVVDKNGFAKTTGDIDGGDKVQVTSADGKIKVMYTFGTPTSNQSLVNQEISVYPNPTNGKIQVNGVKAGNRIRVFSSTGAVVRNVIVKSSMEVLSLENQPGGMYMIVVSGENSITARFKVIKF